MWRKLQISFHVVGDGGDGSMSVLYRDSDAASGLKTPANGTPKSK
jgi:hypothetical protein